MKLLKISRHLEAVGTITIIASIVLACISPTIGVSVGMFGLVIFLIGRFQ